MTDAKRAEVVRDSILKMLSDQESAKVSTAETASRLTEGGEYLDLEHLDQGVQRAEAATKATMGHVLPRSAVSNETWSKILAQLARARGTVKWFNSQKGYGYIQPQGGGGLDVLVHISAVERAGLSSLNEGQVLEYDEVLNRGGITSAENLKVQR